jgi:aspartate kinase
MFSRLAQKGINIDVILQSVGRDGTKDISFTCAASNAEDAVEILEDIFSMEGAVVACDTTVAKISIVGAGMQSHSGTASKMFGALYEAGINISMISTSEITISVLIDKELADKAVAAVHAAFFG